MTEITGIQPTANPLVFLERFLERNPDRDPTQILDFLERLQRNQAAVAFADAITRFQGLCPPVEKTNPVYGKDKNLPPHYFFASFDDVMDVAGPHLKACGIVVTFTTKTEGNLMTTTCHVRVGTHVEDTEVTLSLPVIPNANDSQRAGGALAYGKRYSMVAALNIRVKGEDNDAQGQELHLNDSQTATINDLLAELRDLSEDVDKYEKWKAGFFKWLKIADLNELKAADYLKAKTELERVAKKGRKQ